MAALLFEISCLRQGFRCISFALQLFLSGSFYDLAEPLDNGRLVLYGFSALS